MKKLILISFLFFSGCIVGITPIPEPETENAKLYSEKCSTCHSLAHPKRHTADQWENVIAIMEKRMREKGVLALEKEEKSAILQYLKKHARTSL